MLSEREGSPDGTAAAAAEAKKGACAQMRAKKAS